MHSLLATLTSLSIASPASPAAHAVIIGSNISLEDATPPLRYADDDAVLYTRLFDELQVKTFLLTQLDEATRRLYPELVPHGPPTRGELEKVLEQIDLEQRTAGGGVFYFLYAGHGDVRDGEGYLTLADGPLRRTDFFTLVLSRTHAQQRHVIIDACKSYFMVFDRGESEERIPVDGGFDAAPSLAEFGDVGFVLSTSSAQTSHEWEALQAGVFSHEVRSALRGGADIDMDGKITYPELAGFVHAANQSIPNEKYRPKFVVAPPMGNGALLDLRLSRDRSLTFDRGEAHHLYVETAAGVRLADLRPGAPVVRLKLPNESVFVYDEELHQEYRISATGDVRLSRLQRHAPSTTGRGAAHEAFRSLFATPFDSQSIRAASDAGVLRTRTPGMATRVEPATRGWLWAGMAGSAGMAAGGLVMRLLGDAAFSEHERAPSSERASLRARTEQYDTASAILLTVGGVTAAATFLYWLFHARHQD